MKAHKADRWVTQQCLPSPSPPLHLIRSSAFPKSTKHTSPPYLSFYSFYFFLPQRLPSISFPFFCVVAQLVLFLNVSSALESILRSMKSDCTSESMSTVSKEDNSALSSEDSSCPDESELELGLGLSLSRRPCAKSLHYARILTAKDFTSVISSSSASSLATASSTSSSSSSTPSSLTRANVTAGTKRTADSVVANNGPSQVVGWPPLRASRMNSFNNHSKSPATDVFNSMVEKNKSNNSVARKSTDNGSDNNKMSAKDKVHLRSSWFVKVNMDGLPIGRKVDLSSHSSYESLAHTLEEMFNERTAASTCKRSNGEDHGVILGAERQLKLLDGSSKFVLTYEDREGDWMLVGDVPWGMFLSSVRRLRIMQTSDANGLAPSLEEKNSRRRSEHI